MNYIFVHLLNDLSGSPRVLSDLIKNFPSKGRKIIITNNDDGFLSSEDVDDFFCCYYRLSNNKYLKLIHYALNQLLVFFLLSSILFSKRLKREDVTIVVNTLLPFGALLSAKIFRYRTIAYIHETYISPPILNVFLTNISRFCSNYIIFVSNYVKKFHRDWSKNISNEVIYNPLRDDFNDESVRIANQVGFLDRYLLFVGTLKEYKGIYNFLLLAEMLPERKFIAVINSDENDFSNFIATTKLPSNIKFLRRPKNIDEIYSKALFTLNMSIPNLCIETFGLTLLESMHFSVPVIAPNVGGPLELVTQDVGYLVDPLDLNKIKDIILNTDESVWSELSKNAFRHSKNFSLESYIQKVSKIM